MKKVIIVILILLCLAAFGLYLATRPDAPVLPFGDETAPWEATNEATDEATDKTESRVIKFETARFGVPADWSVRDETGGLVLTPPGTGGNGVRIEYYPDNDFGVCGTGLREETYILPCGADAKVGYYSGTENWSFVCADNGYVMLNEGLSGDMASKARDVFFAMNVSGAEIKEYEVSELSPELVWVNYSETGFGELFGLNGRYIAYGSRQALPSVILRNRSELDDFAKRAKNSFSLDSEFSNENGQYRSFTALAERFTDDFFAKKTLVITYIPAGSGSEKFSLEAAFLCENALEMRIISELPEVYTCDMAGWFLLTAFPAEDVKNVKQINTWK